ncbi:pyrroline-5-carboxylate reductase [Aliikangiella coralliicola]|uniref:Pyrroline-5-carboxylate reductase n=1 Tax=Aliikangiella coralliicola TaxID=2592383 RepID=A0A545U778_9GAMM|nr:pyrroline-5-carboxylate reductase [Aliikangiella coralliicola]TQV85338.1 pyrroline-5-carboxylate reductase [Aliikangiella coralliicola]
MTNYSKIAFIGCGNMATAIISGLVASGWPVEKIMASNPSRGKLDNLADQFSLQTTNDNREAANFGDIVVLAVKPQKLPEVCLQLSQCDFSNKLVISVAAGFRAAKIADGLKQNPVIIRAMPNTPALIGLGATGLYATSQATENNRQIAESIFQAVGQTNWVSNESHIDIVTAIAGSSPAYIFLMMQSMVEQAVSSGLPEQDAFDLITQAVSGAAQLAKATPAKTLNTLRKEVTSPGGTTAAAITVFKNNEFEDIVKKAVSASIQRGRELGNHN